MQPVLSPFAKPMYIMAKPIGSVCNLACEYCYYLEKGNLYDQIKQHTMSDELLEKFVREYIESQSSSNILFTWHGGETLMRPVSFYKKAIEFQKKYGRGKQVDNCFQTNGTLITEEWCKFFRENNILVGVSIDGPQEFHDEYRRNRQGLPSFHKVMKGIQLLNKYNVEWNAMAVVNDFNVEYPLEFYNFFKSINCKFIQFAPIVERINEKTKDKLKLQLPNHILEAELTEHSITPEAWGNFLCTIFDEWVKQDVGEYFIQLFDATLANWMGVQPGICTLAKTCGHAGVIEFNGDVYSCDHFVFPSHKLGNIYSSSLIEMMYSPMQLKFGNDKFDKLTTQCKDCEYLFACYGECPKNRFITDSRGEFGHNYLCKGYYQFFNHVAPYMDFMKQELLNERPPANIMNHLDSIK